MQVKHSVVNHTEVSHTDTLYGDVDIHITSWGNGEGMDVSIHTDTEQAYFSIHADFVLALITALSSHKVC